MQFDFNTGQFGFMGRKWIPDHPNPQPEDEEDGILRINNQGRYVKLTSSSDWSDLTGFAMTSLLNQQSPIEIIDTGGDTAFEKNKDRVLALISRMTNPDGPCAAESI